MNWEIYTYGGGDFLRLIFNGIAQIFGDGDYVYALKSAALIGFIGVLINSAFHRRHLDLAWILGVIMIFQILIVPKTHLVINDRVVPANSAVVENVPLGIAATASIFSKFSDWSTRSFETVFSLPNEIKYSGNGLLFAQTLVEESTRFEITTPSLSANLSDFWKSCVYYDLLLGLYSWSEILRATDLVDFLAQKTSKTRSFTYEQSNSGHNREIVTCRDGFNELLKKDIENEIANSTNIQGARLVPNSYNRNEAVSRFVSTMPVAYHYLTNLSLTNSKIISQNILANSFKRGLLNFATDTDASAAAEDFSMAKAEAERKTTFSVMGKLAKKMLPILHNIFESFIYAIFPVVMIMAMLPNATKILSKYAMALFWVNLWSPLYAILHFAASYHGQKAATVAMIQSGEGFATGLSIMTNTALGNILSDYAAITGYLSLSIPMISWLVINASGSMMAGLAGRLMDGYDRPVSSAASESSTGNISLGQFHYQNQTSFQSNTAPQSSTGTMSIQNQSGVMETVTSSGQYFRSPLSSLPISIDFSNTTSKALRNAYSESKSYEQSMASEQSKMSQFAVGQLSALGQQINESKGLSQMFNESERNTLSHSNEN
ncbi:MAG: conjugal transfer protein TraG N-terminal domain-containing protein, partial [Oligoflexia bacterium]|nr:conjugal transfer protein TraG N-terminal domain-containing protein [Oligoflexia bacterium]